MSSSTHLREYSCEKEGTHKQKLKHVRKQLNEGSQRMFKKVDNRFQFKQITHSFRVETF